MAEKCFYCDSTDTEKVNIIDGVVHLCKGHLRQVLVAITPEPENSGSWMDYQSIKENGPQIYGGQK